MDGWCNKRERRVGVIVKQPEATEWNVNVRQQQTLKWTPKVLKGVENFINFTPSYKSSKR